LAPTAAEGRPQKALRTVNHALHYEISPNDLNRMERARVREVRITLFWPAVEARENQYNWAQPDAMVGGLASRGIRPLPILVGSPSWTSGESGLLGLGDVLNLGVHSIVPSSHSIPPLGSRRAREGWQRFVRLAVERYGRGGTFWEEEFSERYPGAQPRPIRLWQVWNEPNLANTFRPEPDPELYGELLRLSEEAIHGVQPGARIALGGIPGPARFAGWDWLDRLYQVEGVKDLFDVVAVHSYSADMRDFSAHLARFRDIMRRNGDGRSRIWLSEMGYGSARGDHRINLGPQGQAKALREAFRTVRKHRRQFAISRVSWFNWRDPDSYRGACEWCPNAGLFDAAGRAKPSWRVYRRSTQARHR